MNICSRVDRGSRRIAILACRCVLHRARRGDYSARTGPGRLHPGPADCRCPRKGSLTCNERYRSCQPGGKIRYHTSKDGPAGSVTMPQYRVRIEAVNLGRCISRLPKKAAPGFLCRDTLVREPEVNSLRTVSRADRTRKPCTKAARLISALCPLCF